MVWEQPKPEEGSRQLFVFLLHRIHSEGQPRGLVGADAQQVEAAMTSHGQPHLLLLRVTSRGS